jgi:hypothetical protein
MRLTEGGGNLAVITLPERGGSRSGDGARPATLEQGHASIPAHGKEPEPVAFWLAMRRTERLLEGLGMARNRHRELVIQNCMTRALSRWRQQPDEDLSAVALDEIEDAVGRWFAFVLGEQDLEGHSPLLVGRAALAACQAAQRWPDVLLTYDHLPPDFVEAMRVAGVPPTPPELPGNMLEQQVEYWSLRDCLLRGLGRWTRGLFGSAAPAA